MKKILIVLLMLLTYKAYGQMQMCVPRTSNVMAYYDWMDDEGSAVFDVECTSGVSQKCQFFALISLWKYENGSWYYYKPGDLRPQANIVDQLSADYSLLCGEKMTLGSLGLGNLRSQHGSGYYYISIRIFEGTSQRLGYLIGSDDDYFNTANQ